MNPASVHAADVALVVVLAGILPTAGFLSIRRLRQRLASGIPYTSRVRDYRNNMLVLWSVTIVMLAVWLGSDRDLELLGVRWVMRLDLEFAVACLLFLGLIGFNGMLLRQVLQSAKAREGIVDATRDFAFAMPHTATELRWFYGLSVTAGVTEELLYRGFLLAFLTVFLEPWTAVPVSALVFAAAHAYQGLRGMLQVTVAGLAFAAMYVLTGSLLLPVVAHILVDVLSGKAIQHAYSSTDSTAPLDDGVVADQAAH